MNVILIASMVVAGVLIVGAVLAVIFRAFNRAVVREQHSAESEMRSYNPGLTYGYKIPVDADAKTQLQAARREAARQAAALPRWANVGIAQGNDDPVRTAYQGVQNDPMSAVKIANVHSWEGLRAGSAFSPAEAVTHAGAVTAPPTKSADDLVPGVDYEFVEITDEMSPAEKRKARIANAKAKSAAMKALKSTAAAAAAPAAPATTPTAAPAATPSGASEPVAGVDYEVIEITDDMDPDEVRKARIANVKAKSAAMKAFKAAGGATAPAAQPEPAATPPPAAEAAPQPPAPTAAAADIAPPELIDIVDGMPPDEMRKARIHNAKAQAAYKKALKEAGIDPSSV